MQFHDVAETTMPQTNQPALAVRFTVEVNQRRAFFQELVPCDRIETPKNVTVREIMKLLAENYFEPTGTRAKTYRFEHKSSGIKIDIPTNPASHLSRRDLAAAIKKINASKQTSALRNFARNFFNRK